MLRISIEARPLHWQRRQSSEPYILSRILITSPWSLILDLLGLRFRFHLATWARRDKSIIQIAGHLVQYIPTRAITHVANSFQRNNKPCITYCWVVSHDLQLDCIDMNIT